MSESSEKVVSVPLDNTPERRELLARVGRNWAFALWEPTPEEREVEAERWREIGRRAARATEYAVMRELMK